MSREIITASGRHKLSILHVDENALIFKGIGLFNGEVESTIYIPGIIIVTKAESGRELSDTLNEEMRNSVTMDIERLCDLVLNTGVAGEVGERVKLVQVDIVAKRTCFVQI